MISTIITAGGSSRRFGENKLLVKLDDKSVVEHTILKFQDLSDEIIIPATPATREFIENSNVCDKNKITFVQNGATMQKSVYNALLACKFRDYVLIHDGARPFIEKSDIEKIIEMLKTKNALCTGFYATDTIKITNDDGTILKTIDRKNVFCAQTPQAFSYELIMAAHKKFISRDDFTDDSSLVEALGERVWTFVSSSVNKKITTQADL